MSFGRLKVIAVVLAIVIIALLVTLCDREPPAEIERDGVVEEEIGPGVQSVVLSFADHGASGMIDERREIVVREDRPSKARQILEELARGPRTSGAVRTLPAGTRVRSVYFDDAGGAYVDFSSELVTNHPGGSTGELFTIRSVVRTLSLNFPDVEAVQFLVDGDEIETIAGHIDASVPFDVGQYR